MSRLFSTPEEAEIAFYEAIESADIKALDDVWSRDENIVCVHPGASRIEGREAVMNSFVELFTDAPILRFSLVDALYTGNESLAVHLVREEIELDGQVISIMVSTNIYHMDEGGWRMLLHHASPEPDTAFQDQFDEYHGFDVGDFDDFDDDLDEQEPPARPPVLH
ncbi:MAG: nuclear transport factor 2 family protein [Granulosicoccus sp.]